MRFSFHLASGPNEKKKTQTPIVRFLQETQRVFSFHLAPRGIFFFFFSFFSPFFFNLFTFFSSVPEGWERTIGKMVIPTQHKKKVCFLFKPTQHQHTHTHTHTHTQKALTQKHSTTQKALTHTDTRKEEGKKKPEKEKSNQKTVAEKKFKRCARHFSLFSKKIT